jgi:hypothetical protein
MDAWINLEVARESSYGNVEWWKCLGVNGEQIEARQHHPDGPEDRPVWCHEDGWMYLGEWKDGECHGFGVYYFLNGRVYVGNLNRNKCSGLAMLFWLPAAPIWKDNELPLSIIKSNEQQSVGLPYIYIGCFEESEKRDPRAKVILKDGTTRIGPFQNDRLVGDWWNDHEKSVSSKDDFDRLFSFAPQVSGACEIEEGSSGENHDEEQQDIEDSWITLEEARERCHGKLEWWKCDGPSGERLEERQYHPTGPEDHPVRLNGGGIMYIGGWKDNEYHGFGLFCFPNGRVFAGNLNENVCSGLAKLTWLPAAPDWVTNEQAQSFIKSIVPTNQGEQTETIGVPYIFIGCFEDGEKNDPRAKVILKDGTTRLGPFKADEPVGDWWDDHEKDVTSPVELAKLVSFGVPSLLSQLQSHEEFVYNAVQDKGNLEGSLPRLPSTSPAEEHRHGEEVVYDAGRDKENLEGSFPYISEEHSHSEEVVYNTGQDGEHLEGSFTNKAPASVAEQSLSEEVACNAAGRNGEILERSVANMPREQSDSDDITSIAHRNEEPGHREESWLTLEEARERSFGNAEWWKCVGLNGEQVEERQHRSDGPYNRPVLIDGNGCMYLGGWKGNEYHGFGVLHFPNGRLFAGYLDRNKCSGPAKLVWLPLAPTWIKNQLPRSAIKRTASTDREQKESIGLPYIYIGCFGNSKRNDPRAKVILKDGTSRIGPFKDDKPVGDWWEDHEKSLTNLEELEKLLSFSVQEQAVARATRDEEHRQVTSSWLTLEEARERSCGKVPWWNIEGPNGERMEERQQRLDGPKDRPVWVDGNGCMYLGEWKGKHCHGFGVFHFPNGRLFAGYLDKNKCSGPAKLVWLPSAPMWVMNEQPHSAIERTISKGREKTITVGCPYIYIGCFINSKRDDPRARVILKDGTTRIGPFKDDKAVGDWWEDHEKSVTSPEELEKLLPIGAHSLAAGGSSPGLLSTAATNEQNNSKEVEANANHNKSQEHYEKSWLTLEEARECSCGKVSWWKCEGPNGERMEVRQHRSDGPADRPIWLDGNGWMYLGGWEGKDYNEFGVIHFPNGRVFAGYLAKNICSGPATLVWLPSAPTWITNEQPRSAIQSTTAEEGNNKGPVGLPYIYIGRFENSERNDPRARVILKDGTTRIGPFKSDKPVGNWWEDHEKSATSPEQLEKLLSFSTGIIGAERSFPSSGSEQVQGQSNSAEVALNESTWLAKGEPVRNSKVYV